MRNEHLHFVTGRLAEPALQQVVSEVAARSGFAYTIEVMPITVAALMTPAWLASRVNPPTEATRIIIPGYCGGDLQVLSDRVFCPVERGPSDLRLIPEYLGQPSTDRYGDYDIEILAEINHAPRLKLQQIVAAARALSADGADIIDVGCDPHTRWTEVGDCVRALKAEGHRVSVDSLNPTEIGDAVEAGAELVLSVNRQNREAAPDWGCPVVAIPDNPQQLAELEDTLEFLQKHNVSFVADPILEPLGCGFAHSLNRYHEFRRRHADVEMLMGIGNLTELTDTDSAAINVMLLGICQELGIRKVLTTQVINWARSSVRECDLARRLVHYAVEHGIPPKHIEPNLVLLRDPRLHDVAALDFDDMAARIKDHNYRVFTDGNEIHALSAGLHLADSDPYRLFERLWEAAPSLDASHAFYLGFELSKAALANQLGKQYEQDESLNWGFLTQPEAWHRLKRERRRDGDRGE